MKGLRNLLNQPLKSLPFQLADSIAGLLPVDFKKNLKETFYLRSFGFFKVPMLFFIAPQVIEVTENRCVIRVPLNRRTKNHLNCMYFGALAAGADCAGGLMAMRQIRLGGTPIALIFKNFQAEFLKRAEGDVLFLCEQGPEIRALVQKAIETLERVEMLVDVTATVPDKGNEILARFLLTLSLKHKSALKKFNSNLN